MIFENAFELVEKLKKKESSALELLEAQLEQIEKENPKLTLL